MLRFRTASRPLATKRSLSNCQTRHGGLGIVRFSEVSFKRNLHCLHKYCLLLVRFTSSSFPSSYCRIPYLMQLIFPRSVSEHLPIVSNSSGTCRVFSLRPCMSRLTSPLLFHVLRNARRHQPVPPFVSVGSYPSLRRPKLPPMLPQR